MKDDASKLNIILETASAEYGSALEMLSACKLSEKAPYSCGYFNHAKDEYNHADIFMSILSKYAMNVSSSKARNYRFTARSLIGKYVSAKGYLYEIMKQKDFIAYVYTNELLAKKSFEGILKLVKSDSQQSSLILQIMEDELRHHGLAKKHFLKHYPRMQPLQLMAYRIRETINNRTRKFYFQNLRILDKLLAPLYIFMAYIAGTISILFNLREFDHTNKNLMELSSKSIV